MLNQFISATSLDGVSLSFLRTVLENIEDVLLSHDFLPFPEVQNLELGPVIGEVNDYERALLTVLIEKEQYYEELTQQYIDETNPLKVMKLYHLKMEYDLLYELYRHEYLFRCWDLAVANGLGAEWDALVVDPNGRIHLTKFPEDHFLNDDVASLLSLIMCKRENVGEAVDVDHDNKWN